MPAHPRRPKPAPPRPSPTSLLARVASAPARPAALGTRDRVLATSLELFNREGVAAVSTHRIATETDISPGNLHYHFKTKQQVVERLFRRFEERLAPCLEAAAGARAIDDVWLALHMTFEAVDAYRFAFRDVAFLLHEYPTMEDKAQDVVDATLDAARQLCAGLADGGTIEAAPADVEMLAVQIVFTVTCWFSFTRLSPRLARGDNAEPGFAAYYVLTLLAPYVTGEGRDYLNYLRGKYLG